VFGNEIKDGGTVTIIKSVKLRGGCGATLCGTKVRDIRIADDSGDRYDIDAQLPRIGRLKLKPSTAKKP